MYHEKIRSQILEGSLADFPGTSVGGVPGISCPPFRTGTRSLS